MRDYHSNQRKHRYKNGHYRPLLYDAYKKSLLSYPVMYGSPFARNGLATILVVAVAFLVGFRPKADFAGWLLVLLILSLYILAISWCSIFFGIIAKSPEGAGAFSVFAIILPYLSSGFVANRYDAQSFGTLCRTSADDADYRHLTDSLAGGRTAKPHIGSRYTVVCTAADVFFISYLSKPFEKTFLDNKNQNTIFHSKLCRLRQKSKRSYQDKKNF